MEFKRFYTTEGTDPFSMFEYESYDCVLKHHETKDILLEMRAIEMPKAWSINARNIMASKYFRKGGVPASVVTAQEPGIPSWLQPRKASPVQSLSVGGETSIRSVVHRIVGHWTYVGFKNGYFDASEAQIARGKIGIGTVREGTSFEDIMKAVREMNARAYFDEMIYMMLAQKAAPNSPQWFNSGLFWAYGITGPAQGHYFVDLPHRIPGRKSCTVPYTAATIDGDQATAIKYLLQHATRSPNTYEHVQAHACFILDVEDTLMGDQGIVSWVEREARIFKGGSGSGANLSKLRGKGEKLSGGGKSSGLMSWIEAGDRMAGAIKSGGTVRRAAKMVCIDLDHPDVLDFIKSKTEAEFSVASMVAGSEIIQEHCQGIMDAVGAMNADLRQFSIKDVADALANNQIIALVDAAKAAHVSDNYINKALQLATQGETVWPRHVFINDFEGRAYQIAPHQNGNYSVRIPKGFYEAVDRDHGWDFVSRTTGEVMRAVPAQDVESAIARACWFSGDPGVMFDSTINDWNVTPADGRIAGTNPCAEHQRLPNSACNLASLRLMGFFDGTKFDYVAFRHAVRLWQITLDITNTMAHLPDAQTAVNVYLYRDTGLGFADLGAFLMAMAIPYGSERAYALAGAISAFMQGQAHLTSAEMAESLGTYPRYEANKNDHLRCVHNHMKAATACVDDFEELTIKPQVIDPEKLRDALGEEYMDFAADLNRLWNDAWLACQKHGLRNAELTVIAPTGTIGFVMDCDTTGVEPLFGLKVFKQLVGGNSMDLVSKSVGMALTRLGYSETSVANTVQFVADHGRLPTNTGPDGAFFVQEQHLPIFATALSDDPKVPAIAWECHIRMMAAVQSFISGAISKTVNMPGDATIADVRSAFRMAHNLGLKAVAIYRDGSKLSQPLTIVTSKPAAPVAAPAAQARMLGGSSATLINPTPLNQAITPVKDGESIGPKLIKDRGRLGWFRNPGVDVMVELHAGKLYLRTTRYGDGRTAEIWVNWSADQGILQALLGSLCKTANVALQKGVPLEDIITSWCDANFEPSGQVMGHPYIKRCRSIVNLMAKLLAFHELGDTDVLNVKPAPELVSMLTRHPAPTMAFMPMVDVTAQSVIPASAHIDTSPLTGTLMGNKVVVTGVSCPECGSEEYIPSGAGCYKCAKCGTAGGCG